MSKILSVALALALLGGSVAQAATPHPKPHVKKGVKVKKPKKTKVKKPSSGMPK